MAKKIIFLNPISKHLLASLNEDTEIKIECEPLISIQSAKFDPLELDPNIAWVFSSKTAVNMVKEYTFPKTVYCIGEKTAEAIPQAIIPDIPTAESLANLIVSLNEKKVIFICGDKRRDELPNLLKLNTIQVKEVIVYKTKNIKKSVNLQGIDGLAFMSPSAVYSMNENGGFGELPCFAIGPTTAQALESLGQNFIISKQSNAKSIVNAARQYFFK